VKRYQLGAHTKHDLKVHLVWVPKYRKKVLTGELALRVRDLLQKVSPISVSGQQGKRISVSQLFFS